VVLAFVLVLAAASMTNTNTNTAAAAMDMGTATSIMPAAGEVAKVVVVWWGEGGMGTAMNMGTPTLTSVGRMPLKKLKVKAVAGQGVEGMDTSEQIMHLILILTLTLTLILTRRRMHIAAMGMHMMATS
jgi:hypothetical protein